MADINEKEQKAIDGIKDALKGIFDVTPPRPDLLNPLDQSKLKLDKMQSNVMNDMVTGLRMVLVEKGIVTQEELDESYEAARKKRESVEEEFMGAVPESLREMIRGLL